MRQYVILYRRAGSEKFGTLQRGVHVGIYARPEVEKAIAIVRENRTIEGVAVRLGGDLFNVMSFEQPALAANAFAFDDDESEDAVYAIEPLDKAKVLANAGL